MSRARNIKPGFFKNETLAECHPLARILFSGLWCEADREGRLEDRPKRLKAECLPYDDCDANDLLEQLASRGFIHRYESAGIRYIQILEFLKHQNPHVREMPSSIPAPSDAKHNLGNAQAQPRQDQGDAEHGTGPADSSFPLPDSPSQEEIDTHATLAGECGKAMRKAGCHSINHSNPDFLAAIREGISAKEFADAVTASKDTVSGAGLFTYAVKVARTNHAKVAAAVIAPTARAGPARTSAAPMSKTLQALHNLEAAKHAPGLDHPGDQLRIAKADFVEP